jgi:predicted  nucleic acid-binding Zn-ribbon protein
MNPLELRPQAPERCAFCHDDLDEATAVCASCRTVLHRDCRELLGVCPTLGCRESRFTLRPGAVAGSPIRRRPAFDRALANVATRAEPVAPERAPKWHPAVSDPFATGQPFHGVTCAICLYPAGDGGWKCSRCGVVVHRACGALSSTCVVAGCDGEGVPPEAVATAPNAPEAPLARSREAFENAKKRLLERSATRPRETDGLGPGLEAAEIERARREYREARATADAILARPAWRPSWLRRLLGRIAGRP